jgi:hypothetical protein
MSTHSVIIIENDNGTADGIYCHWDGYPENQMPILTKSYTTEEKVRELISLGNISSLGNNIGEKHKFGECPDDTVNAYHRDREEAWKVTKPMICGSVASVKDNVDHTYFYVFNVKNNTWTFGRKGDLIA